MHSATITANLRLRETANLPEFRQSEARRNRGARSNILPSDEPLTMSICSLPSGSWPVRVELGDLPERAS
jgi:hypothetical protein